MGRQDLGRLLREKEKALIGMLDRHQITAQHEDEINVIRDRISQASVVRKKTSRYDGSGLAAKWSPGDDNSSALEMQAVVDQVVADMNKLRDDKNKTIDRLTKELHAKTELLEEHVSRLKTIKHYGRLLVNSSNIYVHKNKEEISESDKVLSHLHALLSQH